MRNADGGKNEGVGRKEGRAMRKEVYMNIITELEYTANLSYLSHLLFSSDLTTYDTAKQAILRNTSLEDNALTHALAR